MKMTSEALRWAENFDFDSTGATWHESSTREVPTEIPASEDVLAGCFPELSNFKDLAKTMPLTEKRKLRMPIPLVPPKIKSPEYVQEILQDWEGIVESVGNEFFTARLRDLTNNEVYPSETAELPIEDISDDDLQLLRVGAVFYLVSVRKGLTC